MVLVFTELTKTARSLGCVEVSTGSFYTTPVVSTDKILIPVTSVIRLNKKAQTEAEKKNIQTTAESATLLQTGKTVFENLNKLEPLAETATDEEKAVREVKERKLKEEIADIRTKLHNNAGASAEAKKYNMDFKSLLNDGDKYVAQKIETLDKPVFSRYVLVLVDGSSLELVCNTEADDVRLMTRF